ncbi:MAG: histidine phosphatase family protein [bacterium]|nr:histidine phosphatase family protein [bacterium]MCP5067189.1 histidine phosphatase family protein [bacterium]
MSRFLAIRHAESTMNAAGLWQGQADAPLSQRGREQARALAEELRSESIAALVCSDLSRARETAEILAGALDLSLRLEPGLREMDVGAWSAQPHAELVERYPEEIARVRAGDWDVRPGGGECRREVRGRAIAALECARASLGEGLLAVVTHMGVLRAVVPGITLANAEARMLAWDALILPEPDETAVAGGPL